MKERHQIKDFKIALKDLEPIVRNPKFLWNGREMGNFSLLPREIWANWLLCVVFRHLYGDRITFAEDKDGDGLILHEDTREVLVTEHVSSLDIPKAKRDRLGEEAVIDAINHKIDKGDTYAKGKALVVFFDGVGKWHRNKIREAINGRHSFEAVYGIGLLTCGKDGYFYSVTQFFKDHSVSFEVHIHPDFENWSIKKI
ncbi:hypothetical protein JKY72_01505 [Candidatus Gracilibacteria bacterium]|nr:hypothetical protein [Candidatus Gracilibacteria bacterium]